MRKVLAVVTALMLAAIVFVPAMGYTISSQGKTNYTINSERVNYTMGSGTPAHEMVYSEEIAKYYPTYSITSTPMPYSIKLGAMAKYSIKPGINATKIEVLGGAAVKKATANVTASVVAAKKATANVTASVAAAKKATANVTTSVAAVTKAANVTAPAVAAGKLSIKGMVRDQNQTGLAGWKMELATSSNKLIAKTNTSANGNFAFSNLNPGDYLVTEVLPTGWTVVTPADGVASVTLKDKEVTQDFVNKRS
jgi:hypothetical protein